MTSSGDATCKEYLILMDCLTTLLAAQTAQCLMVGTFVCE